jgi:predicted nucleic acid-binding protein
VTIVDTSALVESLAGPPNNPASKRLRRLLDSGDRLMLPTIVLYEWLRGPRSHDQIAAQEAIFPSENIIVFGSDEARVSADIYRSVRRPRGREFDIAIAACAILRSAPVWTLNPSDYSDIPGIVQRAL